jgi:hypothetical protein
VRQKPQGPERRRSQEVERGARRVEDLEQLVGAASGNALTFAEGPAKSLKGLEPALGIEPGTC